MKKLFLIGIKDLKLMFRDRAALTFMLLAPFLLTIGMGFVTGRFSGGSTGFRIFPSSSSIWINEDLGNALEDVFNSEELSDLMEPTASSDPEAARQSNRQATKPQPRSSSQKASPKASSPLKGQRLIQNYVQPEPVQIEVYTNPSRPTSAGVVKAIVDEFISRVEEGRTSGMTSIVQLMQSGLVESTKCESEASVYSKTWIKLNATAITLKTNKEGARPLNSTCSPTLRLAWR